MGNRNDIQYRDHLRGFIEDDVFWMSISRFQTDINIILD